MYTIDQSPVAQPRGCDVQSVQVLQMRGLLSRVRNSQLMVQKGTSGSSICEMIRNVTQAFV
jgi:hypothetical protein